MPTPTSDTLFQGDHRGTPNPADPNLFSLGDMAAAMGTDSLAVSVATSKVTSTAASGALDSVPVSTASSRALSAASQASVADSKAVSTSVPTSVADSKAISVSRNTSVADSKAVSLDTALIIPAVNSLPGFLQLGTGAVIRTANTKMAESVSVKDFGAVGNGSTDDTTAINAAIAAINTAGGGQLTFPIGTYRVTASLTPLTVAAVVRGHGSGSIVQTATDAVTVFTLSGNYSGIKDLAITSAIATPASAVAVLFGASNNFLEGVQITQFFTGVLSNDSAYSWFISRSHIYNSFSAGISLTYGGAHADQGDCTVHSTTIEQNLGTTGTAAVRYAAHGGLRVVNCKFLQHDVGIDLVLGDGANTADLLVTGNSMENQAVACVRLRTSTASGVFRNVLVTGNELAALSTGSGIIVTSFAAQQIQHVVTTGNRLAGAGAGIGIDLVDVGAAIVDGNSFGGFTTGVKIGAGNIAVDVVVGDSNLFGDDVTYPIQDLSTTSAVVGIKHISHIYRRALPSITSAVAYTNVFQVIMSDTAFHGCMIELTLDGILQGVGSFARVVRKLLTYDGANVTVTPVEDVAGGQTINVQFDASTTAGSVLIGLEKPAGGTGINGTATLRCEGSVNRVVRL